MREGEGERETLGRGYRKGKQSLREGERERGGGGGRKAGGSGGICFFHIFLRVGFVPYFLILVTVLVKNESKQKGTNTSAITSKSPNPDR